MPAELPALLSDDRLGVLRGVQSRASARSRQRVALRAGALLHVHLPRDTLLESLFLHRFWTFAVEWFVPRWVALNLMTLVGLLHAVVAYALLLVHSPELDGGAPSWVYATCAACLFVYQTMDGDGREAGAPHQHRLLGEVDHGADAIAACVYGVFICDVFGLGLDAGLAGFGRWPAVAAGRVQPLRLRVDSVTATYTGRLPVARLDAQELQIIVQLALLRNAAYGVEVWKPLVRLMERTVPLGLVVVLLGAAGGAWSRADSAASAILRPALTAPFPNTREDCSRSTSGCSSSRVCSPRRRRTAHTSPCATW